jgi:hypothetical protein
MENDFICPICRGYLRVGNDLIFSLKKSDNKKGLILLSPELGNYTFRKHPAFELVKGEELVFYCPICHANLTSDVDKNLVKVIMIDEKGEKYEILFSDVVGEKSTYKVKGKEVIRLGEDAERYRRYWDLPDEYKKYL